METKPAGEMDMRSRAIVALGVALIFGTALWGCGSDAAEEPPKQVAAKQAQAEPKIALSAAMDYDPIRRLTELADMSKLAVRGEIVGVSEGRTTRSWYSEDGYDDLLSLVVTIRPDQVEVGARPANSDGNIYLELEHFGFTQARVDDLETLRGRETVVYLVPALQHGAGTDDEILDPQAGRPEGQPLFRLAHPQGFHIETADGEGAWDVGEGRAFVSGTTLDELSSVSGDRIPEYQPWEE